MQDLAFPTDQKDGVGGDLTLFENNGARGEDLGGGIVIIYAFIRVTLVLRGYRPYLDKKKTVAKFIKQLGMLAITCLEKTSANLSRSRTLDRRVKARRIWGR